MATSIESYFSRLGSLGAGTAVWDRAGNRAALQEGIERVIEAVSATRRDGRKLMFIGNGGSAGIASHMAIDYSKNGGIRAQSFNDPSLLTCLANDYGYERVFSRAVEIHGDAGDLLIAISSSGRSPNILNAVGAARNRGCRVVTFSGFSVDNPLVKEGDWNFHVASDRYGFVELAHLGLCHAILDILMGWEPGDIKA